MEEHRRRRRLGKGNCGLNATTASLCACGVPKQRGTTKYVGTSAIAHYPRFLFALMVRLPLIRESVSTSSLMLANRLKRLIYVLNQLDMYYYSQTSQEAATVRVNIVTHYR